MAEFRAVNWYTCTCDWWTKFCDEHHRAFARVPVEVLEQYRVAAPSYEEEEER